VEAAQDPDERFDVVDEDGRPTGRVKRRADVHRDGDWHRAVHVWVAGRGPDAQAFLLFQRRGLGKDTWPGRLDATVGGHLRAGEDVRQALREVEEEIGVVADPTVLLPLGRRRVVHEHAGVSDRELQDVLLLVDDRPLTAYRPQRAEVAALVRFDLRDLPAFTAALDAAAVGEVLGPDGPPTTRVRFTGRDRVPDPDGYHGRVVSAVTAALCGNVPIDR
jgi:isopentenyldiphosphate isomerase